MVVSSTDKNNPGEYRVIRNNEYYKLCWEQDSRLEWKENITT